MSRNSLCSNVPEENAIDVYGIPTLSDLAGSLHLGFKIRL